MNKFSPSPWTLALDFNLSGRIMAAGGFQPIVDVLLFGCPPGPEEIATARLITEAPAMFTILNHLFHNTRLEISPELNDEILRILSHVNSDK